MDLGFNFRATSAFVTDGSNETFVSGDASGGTPDQYPTTRAGVTFGWESNFGTNTRDRSNSVDRRLAGINFQPNNASGAVNFRVDLPATGNYNIWLGGADATYAQVQFIYIQDTSTLLADLTNGGSGYATSSTGSDSQVLDAAGTVHSSIAVWASNQASILKTFATTLFRLILNPTNSSFGAATAIAHLRIQSAAPTINSASTPLMNRITGYNVSGSAFGASQGAGSVIISPTNNVADAGAVTQTVTAWGDTSITFTAIRGSLGHGTLYLFVKDNSGNSNSSGYQVQFLDTPPVAWLRA